MTPGMLYGFIVGFIVIGVSYILGGVILSQRILGDSYGEAMTASMPVWPISLPICILHRLVTGR